MPGHRGVRGRAAAALAARLDALSQPSRERIALTGFFLGTESAWDRALARAYFGMSSWAWASYEEQDSHHASFRDGLDAIVDAPKAVLDLGTGAGGTAALMATRWPAAQVVGIDTSRRMVAEARRRHGGIANLSFEVGDGLHIALGARTLDLVTSLNYMPFPAEVARVLRPGGSALVASTFQGVGSGALTEQWTRHGFALVDQADSSTGSFQVYRRGD